MSGSRTSGCSCWSRRSFLNAGVLTELGEYKDTHTGNPQGGSWSPLLANIALSALDEYLHERWQPAGDMATSSSRARRRSRGQPNWRVVRYAHDFVVLLQGSSADVEVLRDDVAQVLQPLGLRLSESKTRVVRMSEGFDFLGFRIQWRRKHGSNKWHAGVPLPGPARRSRTHPRRPPTPPADRQDLALAIHVAAGFHPLRTALG